MPPRDSGLVAMLRGNAPFRLLWTARLLSFSGDSVGLIALLLYTAARFHNGLAVAGLMLAGDFVPGLISPIAGAVSDRWDRRTVMISCEVVQCALVTVIALTLPSLPLLLLLVAVQSCVAAVFQPASRAAVPSLVTNADLERANAAIGFGTNGMDALAPLAGAALLAVVSVRGLLLVDAGTFVASAALLAALPRLASRQATDATQPISSRRTSAEQNSTAPIPAEQNPTAPTSAQQNPTAPTSAEQNPTAPNPTGPPSARAAGWRSLAADAAGGLRYLWQDRVIRIVTVAFCTVVLFTAVDDVALVFLARRTLHGSNSAASLVYAGVGLGLLVGFLAIARAGSRLAAPVLILAGYAVASLGNLLTGISFAIVAALGFQVIRGLGVAAMDVGHSTLIQRRVPDALLGRVFGNVYGAVGAAAGLSYVFGGLLLDATSARVTLIVAGAGGLGAAVLAAIALPRALRLAPDPGLGGDATAGQGGDRRPPLPSADDAGSS